MNSRLFPLSYPQRMFWFLDKLEPGTPAYNLPRAFRMEGDLDVDALHVAFRLLLRRHDVLRTSFAESDGHLYQCVRDNVGIDLVTHDLSNLPADQRESETFALVSEGAQKPFDLERPPLFRLSLVRLSPDQHVLILVMHHIITDGWSMSILFKEIASYYAQLVSGRPPQLTKLQLQYVDFAHWQQQALTEEVLQGDIEYWREHLRESPALLQLPSDHPRPRVQSYRGSMESFSIDETLTSRIKQICAGEEVTLYMGLLAALQALLNRYTGTNDIAIGTPVAGRSDPDFSDLIGCFVNTLVMRGDLSGNPTFQELLRRTRAATLGAFAHQQLPFERLLAELKCERSPSYTPLFQIMLILQNAPKQVVRLPGLLIKEIELDSGLAKFDLTLEIVEQDQGLYCQFEYSSDLFERHTIRRMIAHFQNLLSSAVKKPGSPISKLNILSPPERQQIIFDWSGTSAAYSRDATIVRAFEEQVQRTPEAIALREGVQSLSYRELDRRANQVTCALIKRGVRPETPVGIYIKRSIDAIVAVLGVLKAGGPYVPLETSYPKHRLQLLIATCDCRIVLAHRALAPDLPEIDCVLLDGDMALESDASEMFPVSTSHQQAAYIIFTSGSTGVPKGVEGTHRATMNRLEWMYRTYPFSCREVLCQKTALSFVDSVWEIFGPLLRGIPSVIIPEDLVIDLEALVALLARERVTRIVLVPTLLRALLDHFPDLGARLPQLKLWTVSGEYLSLDLAAMFRSAFPEARLLNLYGSSEVAGDVTCYEIGELAGMDAVPIGKPISNVQVYVLDEFLEPVPSGVPGLLYVGGDCLAQGYWRQPDLTSHRFIPNPLGAGLGPLFATGDRARWLSDGNLEYLGRQDTQTKLRGFRIELGEIEANLIAHPFVREAVVVATRNTPEAGQLTAYVVTHDGAGLRPDELRNFLRTRLPLYMVPVFFVELAELPLLPSGKVDRRALLEPATDGISPERLHIEARNEVERGLAAIWSELLGVKEVSVTDNFFDLGGNSLLAMQVLSRIRRAFRVEVSVRSLFDGPTIEALGHAVEVAKASGAVPRMPPIVARPMPATTLDLLGAELAKLSPEQIEMLLRQVRQDANAVSGQVLSTERSNEQ
jgi:amino acid adenylation domain-containing protein